MQCTCSSTCGIFTGALKDLLRVGVAASRSVLSGNKGVVGVNVGSRLLFPALVFLRRSGKWPGKGPNGLEPLAIVVGSELLRAGHWQSDFGSNKNGQYFGSATGEGTRCTTTSEQLDTPLKDNQSNTIFGRLNGLARGSYAS